MVIAKEIDNLNRSSGFGDTAFRFLGSRVGIHTYNAPVSRVWRFKGQTRFQNITN